MVVFWEIGSVGVDVVVLSVVVSTEVVLFGFVVVAFKFALNVLSGTVVVLSEVALVGVVIVVFCVLVSRVVVIFMLAVSTLDCTTVSFSGANTRVSLDHMDAGGSPYR